MTKKTTTARLNEGQIYELLNRTYEMLGRYTMRYGKKKNMKYHLQKHF